MFRRLAPTGGLPRFRLALALILPAAIATGVIGSTANARTEAKEVRALWVQRTSLASPQAIRDMVRAATASGFNTLLVQVRGRGDSYYGSRLGPRGVLLATQPTGFDPLREVLAAAHPEGLQVHAWINANLVASAARLPAERNHIVYRHPEWVMVPRELAVEMASTDAQSPAYIGTLARWTRSRSDTVEGLYLSPVHAGAADHLAAVVQDLVAAYSLDGVHLDYLRYPSAEFDYSPATLAAFRASLLPDLRTEQRLELDARVDTNPAIYSVVFPKRWSAFRRSRLTSTLIRIRTVVKCARPDLLLSAAIVPDSEHAADGRLQDWRTWLEGGLLDVVIPMAYTRDVDEFAEQIRVARACAGTASVWAGIGAYRPPPRRTVENIRTARRVGASGIVLFSYDSFVTPALPHPPDYLTQVGREAFSETALVGAR